MQQSRRPSQLLIFLVITLSLVACAPLATRTDGATSRSNHAAYSASDAQQCRRLLSRASPADAGALDARDLRVLNWNIQKGQQLGWHADLQQLAKDSQLVMIQEAALRPDMLNASRLASFWSFAPGYKSKQAQTGVVTVSSVRPLTQCNLTAWEPWLGTPKATSITEYGLKGSEQTLVVVNIHALNFTFGVRKYTEQMEQIRAALRDHSGPIILSGDFNTWRGAREKRLQALVGTLALSELTYESDQRTLKFGRPLDHIYLRGLRAMASGSQAVASSDHNPMHVNLTLVN